MSAIYGCIQKNEIKDTEARRIPARMQEGYSDCKIDAFRELQDPHALFGCGMQVVLRGQDKEILPFEDEEYLYTFDGVIDNRSALIAMLRMNWEATDSAIFLEAFRQWGERFEEMMDRLYGIFSGCIYRKSDGRVWLFTDATGGRCVHYYTDGDCLVFATTIRPILNALTAKPKLSDRWITYCESNCSADLLLVPELTPYENIFQLECGCYLTGTVGQLEKIRYYHPQKHKKPMKISDEEGMQLFRDTFLQCVEEYLRSVKETGATLSSGLDSSSVACVADGILSKENKRLFTYTSVPVDVYICTEDDFLVENEREGVLEIAKEYPNMDMHFVNCPEKNSITEIPAAVSMYECPQKSLVNFVWLNEIYRLASENQCKLMLKGQYGNTTMSYGMLMTTVYQLGRRGRFLRAYREINAFKNRRHIGRKQIVKVIFNCWKNERHASAVDNEEILCRKDLYQRYGVKYQYRNMFKKEQNGVMDSQKERLYTMWSPRVMAHLGLSDTKLGLHHGLLIRDPMKDRRIMELCMQLPITCFAGNGYERRLVREGMAGIVPRAIRLDVNHRGNQGSDYAFRICKDWKHVRVMAADYLKNQTLDSYLEADTLTELRRMADLSEDAIEAYVENAPRSLIKLLVVCSLAEFLKEYEDI